MTSTILTSGWAHLAMAILCLPAMLSPELFAQEPTGDDLVPVVMDQDGRAVVGFAFVRDFLNPIDLNKLELCKYENIGGEPSLVFLVEQFRTEQRTTQVTRIRVEKRTRKVKTIVDGEEREVDREYEIKIPMTETRTGDVRIPAGKKPVKVPLAQAKVYRLDATEVPVAEVPLLLEKIAPVFLIRNSKTEIKPASEIVNQALNPNLLIVVTDGIK